MNIRDIVLLKEKDIVRNNWLMGRIVKEIGSGSDGRVRRVEVTVYRGGELKTFARPISELRPNTPRVEPVPGHSPPTAKGHSAISTHFSKLKLCVLNARSTQRKASRKGVEQVSGNGETSTKSTEKHRSKEKAHLNFGVLNARSLRNKCDEFVDLVVSYNLDVVAVSETWLRPDDDLVIRELTPLGYRFVHVPRVDKTGGGVGILSKTSLVVNLKTDVHTYASFEAIHVHITSNSKSLRLVNIYRPPTLSVTEFLNDFEKMLFDFILFSSEIVFCGDFNIHMDNKKNVAADRFKTLLRSFGLQQHINEPTHCSGHCLDLTALGSCVSNITDVSVILEDSVESYSDLRAVLDLHAPVQNKTIRQKEAKPWYTDEIRSERKVRRQLERKWMKSKLLKDRQEYCVQRCVVNGLIEKAKTRYYSSLVSDCTGDQKKLFNIVNKLLHHSKSSVLPSSVSDEALAERFSVFFVNKIKSIRDSLENENTAEVITASDKCNISYGLTRSIRFSQFEPASDEEILKIVKNSPSKSCALDPVPTSLIKKCTSAFIPLITHIVNKSLESGSFPESLKVTHVRPTLKKKGLDPEILKNYRPISNLSFLGKIIEKVVSKRILSHVQKHGLLYPYQSAYKAHHSTETALLRVNNDILRGMDDGKLTALVLLDLSAAFDTVDHSVLLNRLSTYIGIEGNALDWCRSYLEKLPQHVCIGDAISKASFLNFSVPQGSVLGPQWFTIYLHQIRDIISKYDLCYHVYADDTQIYISFKPTMKHSDISLELLQHCIYELRVWMKNNFLKLNDEKTEFVLFGSKQQLEKLPPSFIHIGETQIDPARQVRNLGVEMDVGCMFPDVICVLVTRCFYISLSLTTHGVTEHSPLLLLVCGMLYRAL
ncbi:uncharacterized protein [Antedon mediterranea]|uniref:uncharacterized protein n=1 Tax=Antedon mediterranea TaxID=105859 RepID=UPI003AF42806